MKEIRSETKSLNVLLSNAKFDIDFYQREYVWEDTHVIELVNDLSENFLKSYKKGHTQPDVASYEIYFLGTVIVSDVAQRNKKLIVDGQQRLTSLTLLLIALHHEAAKNRIDTTPFVHLIFSQRFGIRSYNIDVEDRTACMEALFRKVDFERSNARGSIANIFDRYDDIEDSLPDAIIDREILPLFVDYLLERVFFVEITAYSDTDAYTMFESMNNRGLSLTQVELLRGYLLSNIDNVGDRKAASETWKQLSDSLSSLERDGLSHAIRHWLRGRHADNLTTFEMIGTDFNRWMRLAETKKLLQLQNSQDYVRLINTDFAFYTEWYETTRKAASDWEFADDHDLHSIRFNSWSNFTLQFPALLAPLRVADDDPEVYRKFRIVSTFIDCILARRIWGGWAIHESYMRSRIFNSLIAEIRGVSSDELTQLLVEKLTKYTAQFTRPDFGLHQQNRRRIHQILARFTDYIGTECGEPRRFEYFMTRGGDDPFEIEHIWANDHDRDGKDFAHPHDFEQYRNRIGCLLLLQKSFNASFRDDPYNEKRPRYFGQNHLAKTLDEQTYERNPNFLSFKERSGLPFRPHTKFNKDDLDERQELYRQIAERIWSPETIYEAGS